MASLGAVEVLCPECGDPVKVTVTTRGEATDSGSFTLTMTPDFEPLVEHYVAEHASDST